MGVVAASGGNHGAAVAYAAQALGIPARIFVPDVSSPAKIARIREYGADLVVGGDSYADCAGGQRGMGGGLGCPAGPAFDQAETMLGVGSLVAELQQQAPDTATVLAAVGGGGLLGGICAGYAGQVSIIGVEPAGAPTLSRALAAGRPVDAEAGSVAIDSLAPRRVGELTFAVISRYVQRSDPGHRRGDPPRPGAALGPAAAGRRAGRLRRARRGAPVGTSPRRARWSPLCSAGRTPPP